MRYSQECKAFLKSLKADAVNGTPILFGPLQVDAHTGHDAIAFALLHRHGGARGGAMFVESDIDRHLTARCIERVFGERAERFTGYLEFTRRAYELWPSATTGSWVEDAEVQANAGRGDILFFRPMEFGS